MSSAWKRGAIGVVRRQGPWVGFFKMHLTTMPKPRPTTTRITACGGPSSRYVTAATVLGTDNRKGAPSTRRLTLVGEHSGMSRTTELCGARPLDDSSRHNIITQRKALRRARHRPLQCSECLLKALEQMFHATTTMQSGTGMRMCVIITWTHKEPCNGKDVRTRPRSPSERNYPATISHFLVAVLVVDQILVDGSQKSSGGWFDITQTSTPVSSASSTSSCKRQKSSGVSKKVSSATAVVRSWSSRA